ncbi:hypothetical protein DFH07DRAFT_771368 [Mycena maculata]|uniref:Uncharacterized protein n=1 Tax=Mycena maculata TaxID=230809 RepID=A0AAD7JBT4_9AGAR|nr:hypothetical protein DFH07DRAFT_771368 [Mycena maculata]
MSVPVFHDVVRQAVEEALSAQRVLRKLSAQKRKTFSLDLTLIALSCRCAWLVDVAAIPDPQHVYADLLRILRPIHYIFNGVEHIFEPCSHQSFFVNTTEIQSGFATSDVAFVLLRQDPELLAGPPPDVLDALNGLSSTLLLPPDLPPRTTIPVAGVLLGYPVAYVPQSAEPSATFLAQAQLDVYACSVHSPGWEVPHTLLKFSCPAALAAAHPARLGSARILAELTARFEPRIKELGLRMIVEHTTEIVNRVAL